MELCGAADAATVAAGFFAIAGGSLAPPISGRGSRVKYAGSTEATITVSASESPELAAPGAIVKPAFVSTGPTLAVQSSTESVPLIQLTSLVVALRERARGEASSRGGAAPARA